MKRLYEEGALPVGGVGSSKDIQGGSPYLPPVEFGAIVNPPCCVSDHLSYRRYPHGLNMAGIARDCP